MLFSDCGFLNTPPEEPAVHLIVRHRANDDEELRSQPQALPRDLRRWNCGIWLVGTGFVPLQPVMVFAMSGSCSFCGKEAKEIFGLAGITHRNSRICNECIELCFDILAEEVGNPEFDPAMTEAGSQLFEDLQRRVAFS